MIKKLQEALRTDEGLRLGYVANIAVAYQDAHIAYQRHTDLCSGTDIIR